MATALLDPAETLRGCCVATQVGLFSGRMVAIVITGDRLIIQKLNRRLEPTDPPLSLVPESIATVRVRGGGTGWATVGAAILDAISVRVDLKTTEGVKLSLMMMTAEGLMAWPSGGETQRAGVEALGRWFADHEAQRPPR